MTDSTINTVMSSTSNRTADSTIPGLDVFGRINQASSWINLLEAHVAILKAKTAKEIESNRNTNHTTVGENTNITATGLGQTFYDQVLELWTAVQNYKIRIQNETNKLFNALAPGVMGPPLSNPEIEVFRSQIIELGNQITPLQILQMECLADKEKLDLNLMENQKEMIKLIAEVGNKMEQAESYAHPRQIQRCNERLMKIKICRCVINCILARSKFDYLENPDLLDLKIKWRHPISLKSNTH